MVILAGVIGEETKLGLFSHKFNSEQNRTIIDRPLQESESVPTKDFEHETEQGRKNTLKGMIKRFLDDHYYGQENKYGEGIEKEILGACFGIAGPLTGNKNNKKATVIREKLDVEFTEDNFQKELPLDELPIAFINDMVAIGKKMFLGEEKEELDLLYQGESQPDVNERRCIMLVSDGLGQALWQWAEKEEALLPISSEGGHCRFAPQTSQQWELCLYFKEKIKQELRDKNEVDEGIDLDLIKVRFENVLSRKGLVNIYKFLKKSGEHGEEPSDLRELLEQNPDNLAPIVKEIIKRAGQLDHPDTLCKSALEMFLDIWGARAGDLGITYESKGGIYIGGISIPIEKLREGTFIKAFLETEIKNSRNYANNKDIPIKVFKEQDIVLWGAARHAADAGFVTKGKFAYKRRARLQS